MKKFLRFFVSLVLFIAIIVSTGWYFFVYDRDFTRDMLLGQARYHDLHGNSRISAMFYDLAYEYSGKDENVAIELANQYIADGNYTKAEVTLSNAINTVPTVELYTALCKAYVDQDKLLDAVNMLANISHPEIKAQLDVLRPAAPVGNYEPGFYSQYIDIALTSTAGTLYYTTDGDYPSNLDAPYAAPITLASGETIIYAISVADNGLVSPLTILGYTVGGVVEPVTFTDAAMEQGVREALGVEDSKILYTDDLWAITEFTVPETVTSFDDLALMPYLRKLTLHGHSLSTLQCLTPLNRLENLDLSGCIFPADSLTNLAALPSLTTLNLSNCGLTTIAALSDVQTLTHLDLSENTIRHLDPLSQTTSLRSINLAHNVVSDLTDLSGLYNLESLNVSYNALTSLSPLAECRKLTRLEANNNQIADLAGVESLSLLSFLALDHNQLTSISKLSNCAELTELHVANNQLIDITVVGTLLKLDLLDFAYNQVPNLPDFAEGCVMRTIDGSHNLLTSLDKLAQLEQISYIYMEYNTLTNIDALADCYHLVQINVFGNAISDVKALTDHNIIVNWDPTA